MDRKTKINKKLWEQWTSIHVDSEFYNLPSFIQGKNSLNELEKSELGPIAGLSVLHLQCHFGMDTLSLARMGAEVTGVDFSEAAITKARELADRLTLKAEFILSDIYDIKNHITKKYDMVFTSYGAITWLPDLKKWAERIAWCLKSGGIFYLVEFHPLLFMFDENFVKIEYPYESPGEPLLFLNVPSYAQPDISLENQELNWHHGIGMVINSLIHHGFKLEFLNEHFYSPYPVFKEMIEISEGRWVHKVLKQKIPYLFSIKAKKI
jgi:SAM-dependent methyltransferase